jgi:hypothetical protein
MFDSSTRKTACHKIERPPTLGSSRENGCTYSYVALEDICEAFLPKKTQESDILIQ